MDAPPPFDGSAQAQAGNTSYKCPQCGGPQTLEPGAEALKCTFCGHVVPIVGPPKTIQENDFESARQRVKRGSAAEMSQNGREVQCKNCGARSVTTLQAKRCPFCDEPLVVDLPPSADTILPDAVLPFEVDKQKAGDKYKAWLSTRWFAPGDLTARARRDGMDGIYVPYWTFDSRSTTYYSGARGEYYYETETYNDAQGNTKTRQVRQTRWFPVTGTVFVNFDDVLVCASKGMPQKRLKQLEPWQLEKCKPFDGAFLAGFVAERYSLDLEEGFVQAQEIMKGKIAEAVKRNIGGDEQRVHDMQIHHQGVTYKHLLLPVWVSSFRYNDKVYRVVVNAKTGEVAGDRPYSGWKIFFFVLFLVAVVTGIVVLIVLATRKPKPEPTHQLDTTSRTEWGGAPSPSLEYAATTPDAVSGYRGFTFA
ncbi:MAG TPA: hypothetical protein VHE35_37115 [Kofleriaceae bacterium]|nr:hypothetical protein [Kofleriaceae bacterium]